MASTDSQSEDFCAYLDAVTDAMHMAGIGYMGAAGGELSTIQKFLSGALGYWTDADGQRVRQWVSEMEYFDNHDRYEARCAGFIKAARHVHRLVMQRLLRDLGMRWPAEGFMLQPPPRRQGKGPEPASTLANVDLPPGHFTSLIIKSPGRPQQTTHFNEHGESIAPSVDPKANDEE